MHMSRTPEYNREYMRKYNAKPKNRKIKQKRDNDRYAHVKKN